MIEQKHIDVIEGLGWNILGNPNDTGVEIRHESPAGEDFVFYTDTEDFPKGVVEYANCFDPDEHAAELIEHRGERGIPDSIRVLIDDADAIKGMLTQLSDALNKARTAIESSDECKEDDQDV